MELKVKFYQIYSNSYEFQKFELKLELIWIIWMDNWKTLLFHWAWSTGDSAQSAKKWPSLHRPFGPRTKQNRGDFPPLLLWLHRPISTSWRRGVKTGIAEVQDGAMVCWIWGVAGGEAHWSGLAVVRCSMVERTPTVKQTRGHRCRASGWRGTMGAEEACDAIR
jgi:hypothetical protein